jgi:predicted nucleic acid-binding protein
MKTSPRIYIDSCCFIDLVKEQVGMLPDGDNRHQDVWFLKQLMKAHQAQDVILHTSFLALAECVAVEPGTVPTDIQERFRSLLSSGQYVSLLAPTPRTGFFAQDIRWKHGVTLKGPDCLHVAAALEAKCVEFLTGDERLARPKIAAAMSALRGAGLALLAARNTRNLPAEYRQGSLLDANKRVQ